MDVGLRVVRGPDWKWQNQDNGEGHVGTVVEVGRSGNSNTPEKTVVVQWDSGFRTNYRVGYQGEYDLLVLDRAPSGVKHSGIRCNDCQQQNLNAEIQGTRWKCSRCTDYDLCNLCYMSGRHDLNHPFYRFDAAGMTVGVKVTKRTNATRLEAKGIFAGAIVVRGPDWDWGNQDGGPGKNGKMLEIRGWEDESGRSVANVLWDSGSTNVYRLGHKGKVDLKYVTPASGGFYYREHLQKLGENVEFNSLSPSSSSSRQSPFNVGDKVRVDLDADVLRVMQEGHGGWNPRMAESINKIGIVHRITDRGDVRVQYEENGIRWTFHSGALSKVPCYRVGDYVKISEDIARVKQLQKGHGEWTDNMKTVLGKLGTVFKIYPDEDMRIRVNGQLWTFNPRCCTLVPQQELNNTLGASGKDRDDQRAAGGSLEMASALEEILTVPNHCSNSSSSEAHADGRLVREAAEGNADAVLEIVKKFPQKVDVKSSGKTALHVSSHQGRLDVVKILLDAGSNLEMKDDEGDTALHYSTFGNQPEIMILLLKRGANINALNNVGCTSLHVAVNKQHVRCVKNLLLQGCDINIQDVHGDTCIHDAISKDNKEVCELLIGCTDVDLTVKNRRGFNILHHASLKGNAHATELILRNSRGRPVVDIQKDDGFTALHLSSLNGHLAVTSALLDIGEGNIDILNHRKQTPLLLAVSQGHSSIVELLISKGANVQVVDEDNQTCLHLALLRQATPTQLEDAPSIFKVHGEVTKETVSPPSLSLACFLLINGFDLDRINLHDNAQCIKILSNNPIVPVILARYKRPKPSENASECMICSEMKADVLFLPCNHQIVCMACGSRMKKCLECQVQIQQKIGPGGVAIGQPSQTNLDPVEAKRMNELQQKVDKFEESQTCSICMENKWNVAFMCGHSACSKCAESLKVCHMCRKTIDSKINLFT